MPSAVVAPLLVFLGGGLGAALRYAVALLVGGTLATLLVNVVGSFAIGLLVGSIAADPGPARLLLVTGLLGGFTTFSTFSFDAIALYQRGQPAAALAYVAASLLLSLAATAAGLALTR